MSEKSIKHLRIFFDKYQKNSFKMNIIYKNTDFTLPVHVVDSDGIIPIEDLEVLNIKVFTTDISTCITFDKTDLDAFGNLHIDASTLADCQNGLVYYKYQAAYPNTAWEDGVYDVARIVQTDNYFKYHDNAPAHKTTCATAVSELVNDIGYATRDWVTEQIENAADASVDLTNYYTKSEVDQKIADISINDVSVDLTNYYTKSEVDELIPDTSGFLTGNDVSTFITISALSDYAMKTDISTFVTATDLSTAIAGIDASVDLSNYYTKDDVDQIVEDLVLGDVSINLSDYATKQEIEDNEEVTATAITDLYQKVTDLSTAIVGIDASVDLSNYYTKSEVDQKIADISIGDVSINIDTSNFIQKANNQPVNKIWVGTENEYQALSSFSNDTLYFVKENNQ